MHLLCGHEESCSSKNHVGGSTAVSDSAGGSTAVSDSAGDTTTSTISDCQDTDIEGEEPRAVVSLLIAASTLYKIMYRHPLFSNII